MGSMFGGQKTRSSISVPQGYLHAPLFEFFRGEIGREPEGVGQIRNILSGNSSFLREMSEGYLQNALLGPAVRAFNQTVRPQIEGSFANIGGTLSSRRSKTISDALLGIERDSIAGLAGILPQLTQTAIGGVVQQENLRYLPTQQALGFATSPTQGVAAASTAGTDILSAAALAAGAAIASDARVKKNIKSVKGAMKKVKKIRGVEFEYRTPAYGSGKQVGVLAQDLERVLPELVVQDSAGIKQVKTFGMEGVLVEALKELDSRLRTLERPRRKNHV